MEQLKTFIVKHKWAIILAVAGILYTLLCFEIGFWRTLLLTIVALVCGYIGLSIDKKKDGDGFDDN